MKKFYYFVFFVCLAIPAYAKLSAVSFPKTFGDLSFTSRIAVIDDGYKPFLDKQAYQELHIVPGEEIYTDHMIAVAEAEAEQQKQDAQTMNIDEYCAKYPYDTEKCPQTESTNVVQHPDSERHSTNYTGYTIGGGPVIENKFVVGGSCYPADHDKVFKNQILTSGRYEKIHPAFEKGLITVFRKEGKCGTTKDDPCGYTCYGIGSNCNGGKIVQTRAEAEDIYYDKYFTKYKIDKLPDVIGTDVFIASMGSGPGTALSQFRRFLGLPAKTTPVDEAMIRAVNNYNGDIHNDWLNVRDQYLQKIAHIRYNDAVSRGYKNAIVIKRKNGCHVRPEKPLYRQ